MDVVKSIGSNILSVSNEFSIKLKDMKGTYYFLVYGV